jgi:hypothetical protein
MSEKKRTLQEAQEEMTKALFEIGAHHMQKKHLEKMLSANEESMQKMFKKAVELGAEMDALKNKIKDEIASVIQHGEA